MSAIWCCGSSGFEFGLASCLARPIRLFCWIVRRLTAILALMTGTFLLALSMAAADPVAADLVLRGGTVYDGSNAEGAIGDVAIKVDRVVAVGNFELAGS